MKVLVVYCHPKEGSFNAAIRDMVLQKLASSGAETRLTDLYAQNFQPVLTAEELECYEECPANTLPVTKDVEDLRWCDTLIFIYPTWWYGLPAILKGWLDRVMVPDVAFFMPDARNKTIRPGLTHIKRLAVFTTCGANWWLTSFVGAPGRRTLFRGIGILCGKPLRKAFAAHYLMDNSTESSRKAHLDRVGRKMDRFLKEGVQS